MLQLTEHNWDEEVVDSKLPIIVDFWGINCAPCQQLGFVLEELEEELGDTIRFGKVDVFAEQKLASRYGVRSIPTLLLFKSGSLKKQVVGSITKASILQHLLLITDA